MDSGCTSELTLEPRQVETGCQLFDFTSSLTIGPLSIEGESRLFDATIKRAILRVVEEMHDGETDCEHLIAAFSKYVGQSFFMYHQDPESSYIEEGKNIVKTLLVICKIVGERRFITIFEILREEPIWRWRAEIRDLIWEIIKNAIRRVAMTIDSRQTDCEQLSETFSKDIKTLYEQLMPKSSDINGVVKKVKKIVKRLVELRAFVGGGHFMAIYEKILRLEHFSHYSYLYEKHNGVRLIEDLVETVVKTIESELNYVNLIFIWLIMFFRKIILPNCRRKSRLKSQYEKVTLLILWTCGDVERNPGPAISDVTRDFCKKMISLLVIQYWERKQGRKLSQADYKTKPDGWPDDIWYGDPSTCNNETRNIMLNTIRTTCIDNGVEVSTKWTSLIEKYQSIQGRQCSKQNKKEYANNLHSWLCELRSNETTDQTFDRLPEIDEQERYGILEHIFERMKQYLPDLSSQCLQSRKIGPKTRKVEIETQSTMSPDSEINGITDEVSTVASNTVNENAFDLLAGDKPLDTNATPKTLFVKVAPEVDSQKTANDDFVTENNALSTVQPENFTSFVELLGGNTVYAAASYTAVTPLPYSYESNRESGTISDDIGLCIKRKLDAREINNDTDVATKRYKTANFEDVFANNGGVPPFGEIFPNTKENGIQSGFAAEATLDTREVGHKTEIATQRYNMVYSKDSENVFSFANDGGVSDFGETFPNTEENGILFGFAAEATLTDLMKLIEPELQGIDTIPDHSSEVKADEVQGDNFNNSMLDELAKYLSDEFILEHSFTT